MTSLKFKSILKNEMPELIITEGQVIYCTDTKESYYDDSDEIRLYMGSIVYLQTEQDRLEYTLPLSTLLFYIEESKIFYRYIDSWFTVSYETEIQDLIGSYEELIPKTLRGDNGDKFAPRTLASVVYLTTGENVEDRLRTITRLGKCVNRVIATSQKQMSFEIPFPFEKYLEQGNSFELSIGSIWVDDIRYKVENSILTFLDSSDGVDLGRVLSFKFLFNSSAPLTGTVSVMDGKYISNSTIPSSKLQRVSSAINLDDSTSIATSKAIKSVYDEVVGLIAGINNSMVARFTTTGTSGSYVGYVDNFTLADSSVLYVRLHTDMVAGGMLSVNGSPYYPLYVGSNPINVGYLKGDLIKLSYNRLDARFYLNTGEDYRITSDSYVYYANGGETSVVIDISSYNQNLDRLTVFQNNLRIFKDINYIISNNTIHLLNYAADAGDMFYMEVDRLARVIL